MVIRTLTYYLFLLMIAIASSSVSACTTVKTGPKISCLARELDSLALVSDPANSLVRAHVGRTLHHGRSDKVTLWVVFHHAPTAIQVDDSSFIRNGLDEVLDALLRLGRDDWSTDRVSFGDVMYQGRQLTDRCPPRNHQRSSGLSPVR